jgi:hypothetical protein
VCLPVRICGGVHLARRAHRLRRDERVLYRDGLVRGPWEGMLAMYAREVLAWRSWVRANGISGT